MHHHLLVAAVLLSVSLTTVLAQQQCSNPQGPCLGGTCPAAMSCLNPGAPDETCCNAADIVVPPPTTTAPVVVVTTPPPVGVTTTAATGTCVDKLNPNTGRSDCPGMASYCSNSAYYTLMTDQCPKTCGRCSGTATTAPSTCVDQLNPSTGVSDCTRMASYCNNSAYYTLMTQQCPRTCGRCGVSGATTASSTCVDKLNPNTGRSDCPGMASYCNNSAYYTLMTDQCPRTCGRCSG